MPSQYVTVPCQRNRCPRCEKPVRLLQSASGNALPQFHICGCGFVGEVGVGPVGVGEPEPTLEERMWHAFHHLWGKGHDSPGYDKQQWIELEGLMLRVMGQRNGPNHKETAW